MNETIRIFNSEAKILLDYDLSRVQAIINTLRDETDSLAAKMLSEYEHQLIDTKRLEEDRLQREYEARRIKENYNQVENMERKSDD